MSAKHKEGDDLDLPERKRRILKAIIENYIDTAEPVGSKMIVGYFDLPISSATIRNEMSELEDLGFLEKPHVSAGRVPSYSAYRLYVNELMDKYRVANEELEKIRAMMGEKLRELDDIAISASRVVSQLTNHTSVSMLTRKKGFRVNKVELIPADSTGYSYVLVLISENQAKSHMLSVRDPLPQSSAALLAAAINLAISEGNMDRMLFNIVQSGGYGTAIHAIAEKIVSLISEYETDEDVTNVYVEGASRMLDNREYRDADRIKEFLDYLSDEHKLSALIKNAAPGRVNIKIGPETGDPHMRDASFVYTTYDINNDTKGVIGVIAPTRMDYSRASARLSLFTQTLSKLLANNRNTDDTGESKSER